MTDVAWERMNGGCCDEPVTFKKLIGLPGVPGASGPPGPPGPPGSIEGVDLNDFVGPPGASGEPGSQWFFGEGAPGVLIGARPGDIYLDVLTGTVFKLGD